MPAHYFKSQFNCTAELNILKPLKTYFLCIFSHFQPCNRMQHITVNHNHEYAGQWDVTVYKHWTQITNNKIFVKNLMLTGKVSTVYYEPICDHRHASDNKSLNTTQINNDLSETTAKNVTNLACAAIFIYFIHTTCNSTVILDTNHQF